ncbi:MAG: histone deacetylase, partial [Pseudomonadota bacterium]
PWSKALYVRSLRSVGATLSASQAALKDGIAASLAGGTHHAKRDSGAGFCVFNDVAVASLCLLAERKVSKVLVLDCDVHQGDGTAEILNCDDRVFTFSMHARRNYPSEKVAGDLDIELEDNCSDAQYLTMLQKLLPDLFLQTKPDFVLYLAGADPYRGDRLGRLALSKAGLAARDTAILDAARTRRVPICTVMAGGYARNINDTVAIHATTVERALVEYQRWDRSVRG